MNQTVHFVNGLNLFFAKKLPIHLQEQINQANAYVKKFDFHSFLEVMLHAVSSQKSSLRAMEAALYNSGFQEDVDFEFLNHSHRM